MLIKFKILDISTIEKYDSQKMYQVYDKWHQIAKESFESEQKCEDFENIEHIVFAGMGGSGTIGDVMKSILSKEDIHVNVNKGYTLPSTVDKNTLIVISSVSGNTHETLSILKQAYHSDAKIIAFASGGKIEKFCKKLFRVVYFSFDFFNFISVEYVFFSHYFLYMLFYIDKEIVIIRVLYLYTFNLSLDFPDLQ